MITKEKFLDEINNGQMGILIEDDELREQLSEYISLYKDRLYILKTDVTN